jgi:nucleotide-binding universal stress UspA family protein
VRIAVAPEDARKVAAGAADDLVRHLKAHGVDAAAGVMNGKAPVGQLLRDEVEAQGADLLVMGGYGHTRLHEFVLGGATETILDAPPCAVLLAH